MIIRILALVERGVEQRIPEIEVASSQEFAHQALVPRVRRVDQVRRIVHAGVEDPDHDTGAVDSQVLRAREKHIVLARA